MKKALMLALALGLFLLAAPANAEGPSGSYECHLKDDDCDRSIDEDSGEAPDDADGDSLIDEDDVGDVNNDGNADDDLDGAIDEDVSDDDGDGVINEDPLGNEVANADENQAQCAGSPAAGETYVYAGANGAELCDQGGQTPIDGRLIVSDDGYVAIDGDGSNPGASSGYARIDSGGPHCGDENNQDSTSSDQSENTRDDCG